MKNNTTHPRSTYALLVQSEEKDRNLSEAAVYLLFIASAVFSIWQVALQPVILPTGAVIHTAAVVPGAPAAHPGV